MQHVTYDQIIKNNKVFNVDFNNIKIITIVRNPYERIVSGLFFNNLIDVNTSKEKVFDAIKKYLVGAYDNHNIPQHNFVTCDNKDLIPNIHVLKTENLTTGMHDLGYTDFNLIKNCNKHEVNYYDYLNNESVEIINDFYHFDFVLFTERLI